MIAGADLLQVNDLSTELEAEDGVVRAVDALTLSIARGETFALVGESGCGKSMTAQSILRLLPENGRLTRGAILLEGTDIAQLPEVRMRDVRGGRIGIIFQEPATSLNPVVPVGSQILEVIRRHTPLRGAAAKARALEWLVRVGIPEPERRFDNYPFQLSGGQKQRVMIAIALAAEPSLLIADEPTTALDVTIQRQILDLLRGLQRERGMAMMLITHDLAVVAEMAHRVALMYAGQIVEVAPAAAFLARPLHPYAQALFGALPRSGSRGTLLAAIAGTVPALDRSFAGCRFVDRCPAAHDRCRAPPPPLLRPLPDRDVRCVLYSGTSASMPVFSTDARAPGMASPATVSEAAAPLLELVNYKVWFPIRTGLLRRVTGYFKAVDGISLAVPRARTLALVGESGCGKTTAGKSVLQLLRGLARIEGRATLAGRDLGALDGAELRQARREAQIIFQDPYASLDPRMRVADILAEGIASLRPELGRVERTDRVAALVERVGLRTEALGRYPHEFSGGQRQRIAIARALAVEPKLIVCDEPTSALDVSVQAQILNLLVQLQRELGVAYLFITHNFGVVEFMAHDVAVMLAGRIVEQGPAERILATPAHHYTRALLSAIPRLPGSGLAT
jgi:peptide/nickel transport system ATP-binding protein